MIDNTHYFEQDMRQVRGRWRLLTFGPHHLGVTQVYVYNLMSIYLLRWNKNKSW